MDTQCSPGPLSSWAKPRGRCLSLPPDYVQSPAQTDSDSEKAQEKKKQPEPTVERGKPGPEVQDLPARPQKADSSTGKPDTEANKRQAQAGRDNDTAPAGRESGLLQLLFALDNQP
jgi:hypothetical protein